MWRRLKLRKLVLSVLTHSHSSWAQTEIWKNKFRQLAFCAKNGRGGNRTPFFCSGGRHNTSILRTLNKNKKNLFLFLSNYLYLPHKIPKRFWSMKLKNYFIFLISSISSLEIAHPLNLRA